MQWSICSHETSVVPLLYWPVSFWFPRILQQLFYQSHILHISSLPLFFPVSLYIATVIGSSLHNSLVWVCSDNFFQIFFVSSAVLPRSSYFFSVGACTVSDCLFSYKLFILHFLFSIKSSDKITAVLFVRHFCIMHWGLRY